MTKEEFKQLFTNQIDNLSNKIRLSNYLDDVAENIKQLHYILLTEYSLENVTMELISFDLNELDNFDCANLSIFDIEYRTVPFLTKTN